MSRADTLLQIKDAEAKASQIKREADEKQRAIVATARKDAIRKIQGAEEKQRADYDIAYAGEKTKVSSQRDEILSKGKAEAATLKAMSEQNVPKAKAHLKMTFEASI